MPASPDWVATIVGGGSDYTLDLVDSLCAISVPARLNLVDSDELRVDLMRGLIERSFEAQSLPCPPVVAVSPSLTNETANVDVVISLPRAGGLRSRHQDEERATKEGLVGQETQGWGGFASALRNAPVIADVARRLASTGSEAWHLVVTNPVDIMVSVARTARPSRTIGLCDMPWKILHATASSAGRDLGDLSYTYIGLNHLSWVVGLTDELDNDVLAALCQSARLDHVVSHVLGHDSQFAPPVTAIARATRAVPSPYLRYYYCANEIIARAAKQRQTRAEECMRLHRLFADACDRGDVGQARSLIMRRGGYGVGQVVARTCAQVLGHESEEHAAIPCSVNGGALPFLDDGVIVEAPRSLPDLEGRALGEIEVHPHIRGLTTSVATYETLCAEAALTGAFDEAVVAGISHPLISDAGKTRRMLTDTIAEQKRYLPQFA